jgi:hypothetical protein
VPDSIAAPLGKQRQAKRMRPNWMKTGTGYQSVPITMGGASNDIETPCALRSGEYEYEIWLFQGRGTIDNPDSRISGKIVVK